MCRTILKSIIQDMDRDLEEWELEINKAQGDSELHKYYVGKKEECEHWRNRIQEKYEQLNGLNQEVKE